MAGAPCARAPPEDRVAIAAHPRTEKMPPSQLPHDFLATAELAEELLHRSRQCGLIQAIDDVLTLALIEHQLRLLEDRKVARYRGLREVEVADDLSDRALIPFEQPEDLLPGAVRERFEHLGQMPLLSPEVVGAAVDVCHDLLSPWSGGFNSAPPVFALIVEGAYLALT